MFALRLTGLLGLFQNLCLERRVCPETSRGAIMGHAFMPNEGRERGTATGSDSFSEGTLMHIQPRECILWQGTVPRCCS